MANFQRFSSLGLLILLTAVTWPVWASHDGPGGTGGGDLANSDLLDFSENAGLVEITPEKIRGYYEATDPALKRLEFFIPDFAQDLKKAIYSKKWLIDPRGVFKPQDDQNTISGVSFEGRMAYQDERKIRINGKLLKSKRIPDAIWGKLIVHEGVRALSMNKAFRLGRPLTEDQIHEIVRMIYAPQIDDQALEAEVRGLRDDIRSDSYIIRSQRLMSAESSQKVEEVFCSAGESMWRALPFNDPSLEALGEYNAVRSPFSELEHSLLEGEPGYLHSSGLRSTDDFLFIAFMANDVRGAGRPPELPASKMDEFIRDAHEFCARNRARIERLSHLREEERTIASLDQIIKKIVGQKITEPENARKPIPRSKKHR
jgi:hypothetical protein